MIGWTRPLMNSVIEACGELGDVWICKTLESASSYEVDRSFAGYDPEVLFLELPETGECDENLETYLERVSARSIGMGVVTFSRRYHDGAAALAASLGLPAPLSPPFPPEVLEKALIASMDTGSRGQRGALFAFLSSRAGSGATTVGLNTAYTLVNGHGRKALFIDMDETTGAIDVLGSARGGECEAPQFGLTLTPYSWRQHLCSLHGLDILSGMRTMALTQRNRWAFRRLIGLGRSAYDNVMVNLRRLDAPPERAILREVDRLCLVTTPDAVGLATTRRRLAELTAQGVEAGKVSIVLNRVVRWSAAGEFEKELGLRIAGAVSSEPDPIAEAYARNQGFCKTKSRFARNIASLAASLNGLLPAQPKEVAAGTFASWARALVAPRSHGVAS
ncbi:MAG: hypothetical protein HY822_02185 [Acidobacteria bacterium]|nr:hypothetical protein [Acidobacteriota bacterium]